MSETPPPSPPPEETPAPDETAPHAQPPEPGWGPEAGSAPAGAPAGGWSSSPSGPWGSGPTPPPPGYGFAPPDPAAASGPPWPELIAVGPYTPPRMIRWPILADLIVVVVGVIVILVATNSTSPSQAAWLHAHQGVIDALNRDQEDLASDNPSRGGSAVQYLADWRRLHRDVGAAASLPNPGGSATAPWREMVNDYFNGSAEIIQAIVARNQSLAEQANRDLAAGDAAAAQFNKAMGISSP